ncbi:MAG: efflux RND transporter periplasmic adaptor subunit [Flavobacteriales bacterium]|nr:efflux RND transporter periplasmic adaptor subunit [Flavobacteriales bacterium]MCB0757798.1 efflux RND transporter periplasmic adaptor subunit [Flavobacteriales bacterium]
MKRTIYLITMLAVLASCGTKQTGELAEKRAERDSLKVLYTDLGKQIKEVEEWLALHDSTVERNLMVVTATPLSFGPYAHYIDLHGVVKADESAALYAMGGRVRSIKVKAGDRVHQGQLLVAMDNDLVEKQIAQAETGAELARITFEKQERLWEQHIGSEMQYLQAKTNMEQAEATIAALNEQQRLSNITAPFTGVVDEVMVRVGDMAAPSQPVVRVVNSAGAQIEADVSEVYLKQVKEGAPVKVAFPSIGESFTGKIAHVGNYIDPANRTFKVAVRAPQGETYMRPNLLSDLSIQDEQSDSAMVVPASTVLQDVNGNNYIYVLDSVRPGEATARKVMVDRISQYGTNIRIKPTVEGTLTGGESLVDAGAKNVSDGLTVRIAKP